MREFQRLETKIIALRIAIQEGKDSAIAEDFNPEKFLEFLKSRRNHNM